MTVAEATSRVRGDLKETTGDTVLSKRHIYSILVSSRKTLIERNKHRIYKELPTHRIETEKVNLSEYSCVPLDCEVCRAYLGKVISTKDGYSISGIGSEDLSLRFNLVTATQYQNKLKLDPRGAYAFIDEDYLYLSECLPCIRASYIKDSISEGGCNRLEEAFDIPAYIEAAVFQLTKQELGMYLQRPLDIVQNNNSNG